MLPRSGYLGQAKALPDLVGTGLIGALANAGLTDVEGFARDLKHCPRAPKSNRREVTFRLLSGQYEIAPFLTAFLHTHTLSLDSGNLIAGNI